MVSERLQRFLGTKPLHWKRRLVQRLAVGCQAVTGLVSCLGRFAEGFELSMQFTGNKPHSSDKLIGGHVTVRRGGPPKPSGPPMFLFLGQARNFARGFATTLALVGPMVRTASPDAPELLFAFLSADRFAWEDAS